MRKNFLALHVKRSLLKLVSLQHLPVKRRFVKQIDIVSIVQVAYKLDSSREEQKPHPKCHRVHEAYRYEREYEPSDNPCEREEGRKARVD